MLSGHALCFQPGPPLHRPQIPDAGAGVAFAFDCPGADWPGHGSLHCSAGEAGILSSLPPGELGDE